MAATLYLTLLVALVAIACIAAADDGDGTVRGTITIVGNNTINDGEVVVSPAGTNESAGTDAFSSGDPTYSIDLPPGSYTVYAWAKAHHNSDRVPFEVVANGTAWVNLTVVRIEEIMGTVKDPDGRVLAGAVAYFSVNGTLKKTYTSDDQGKFRGLLNPGNYSLHVTKASYHALDREVGITPGQVLELDLVLEPVPATEEDEPLPLYTVVMVLFVMVAAGLSVSFTMRQARKVRRAALEAEASRSREMLCPECGGTVPEDARACPECSYVFQVRCDECGRSMDAGTEECPECGNPMS
jgi:RNA polymerase subunit RPABC4/transcription elongation factor Spt4